MTPEMPTEGTAPREHALSRRDLLRTGIATGALEQKAYEFESEEARDILEQLEMENGPAGD